MSETKKHLGRQPNRHLKKLLTQVYHKMTELDSKQQLLVANWQRKFYPLSEVLLNSLVGLSLYDTLTVLAMARKGHYG
ncbi:hypothetical protein [Streptococcus suis]|uniref:hypothetical protein n=1 Tax=Streptococcus suis TaxID=1307 RepID=UPI000CF5C7BB|nr:hypothetical protein [Streptococcus suis]